MEGLVVALTHKRSGIGLDPIPDRLCVSATTKPSARCESHKVPWDCIPTDPGLANRSDLLHIPKRSI